MGLVLAIAKPKRICRTDFGNLRVVTIFVSRTTEAEVEPRLCRNVSDHELHCLARGCANRCDCIIESWVSQVLELSLSLGPVGCRTLAIVNMRA